MVEMPKIVSESGLWNRLFQVGDFSALLAELRLTAETIGKHVERVMPGFTDHSIRHMDYLWKIADVVFTEAEINLFTPAEAFVLGSSFYVHDLGMALAATEEGLNEIRASKEYAGAFARATSTEQLNKDAADKLAVQIGARALHAGKALDLATLELPGLGRFLIEKTDARLRWGTYIGQVSASHHWPMSEVERKLGRRGRVPSPFGGDLDLGVLACALRVVDYAHINSERARYLDQLLHGPVSSTSLVHWRAQEHIDGPIREGNLLKFAGHRPILDVDAWWLFYEMAVGLDKEIRDVAEYLQARSHSSSRFSLAGVDRVVDPASFSRVVETDGFEPVDIRIRPYSIERLIEILGGKSIYGEDHTAPLRELIQNASDAIRLRQALEELRAIAPIQGEINVELQAIGQSWILMVSDNGIGMSAKVVSDYLLGIASNYWASPDFFSEFGSAANKLRPAGRFGIGFMSVFMIGDKVEVETERPGGARLQLSIHGVGRRGALRILPALGRPGTSIAVTLKRGEESRFQELARLVRQRVPMLGDSIVVKMTDKEKVRITNGWWRTATPQEVLEVAFSRLTEVDDLYYRSGRLNRQPEDPETLWGGEIPEALAANYRIFAYPGGGIILLCSHGISVGRSRTGFISGIVDVEGVELTAARSRAINWDQEEFQKLAVSVLYPEVVAGLDRKLAAAVNVPANYRFMSDVALAFGLEVLGDIGTAWLPIIHPPGSMVLKNASDFREYVRKQNNLFVAFGTSAWETWGLCRARYPNSIPESPIIILPEIGYSTVKRMYSEDDAVVYGPLGDHFERPPSGHSPLLMAVLSLIAKAWNIPMEALAHRKWSRNKRDGGLCCYLSR